MEFDDTMLRAQLQKAQQRYESLSGMHVEAIKEAQALRVDNELLSSRCKRLELQEEKAVFEARSLDTMQALMEEK
eukprot:5703129-Karenia_brevis.AAC.1